MFSTKVLLLSLLLKYYCQNEIEFEKHSFMSFNMFMCSKQKQRSSADVFFKKIYPASPLSAVELLGPAVSDIPLVG